MDLFNIIAGTASVISLIITLFVASKVIKITNHINVDTNNSKKISQRVSGQGNKVSARDINDV